MKSLVLLAALLFAVTLGGSSLVASKAAPGGKKQAVMQFAQPVRLMGVVLNKGEYLFVHDDEAMARGEACTFVYKGNSPVASKLLVSFHCVPAARAKVAGFTVRMAAVSGFQELTEYQFSGETEAHTVPASK
jgi:hypothetical protein